MEQRTKSTKVNGYTIVILFDNTQQARENAVKAKETFEENFKGVNIDVTYENPWFTVSVGRYLTMEEAIIELGRLGQLLDGTTGIRSIHSSLIRLCLIFTLSKKSLFRRSNPSKA